MMKFRHKKLEVFLKAAVVSCEPALCFFLVVCRLDERSGEIPTRAVFLESQWRVLENMKAQYVSVNGIRKVSCVVSAVSLKKPVY